MNFKKLKLEFFYLRKAFLEYRHGFRYITSRWFLAPQILKTKSPIDKPVNDSQVSVHILTCHRDMVMLLWSLRSFYQHVTRNGKLFIHDDGSLTGIDLALLHQLLPHATVVSTKTFLVDYTEQLQFWPVIKEFRSNQKFFLLKKLIDQYFVSPCDVRLIIDSDLLWFGDPVEIENAIVAGGNNPLMMTNATPAPVYLKNGQPIDDKIASFNSGIVLYRKDQFSLEKLTDYLNSIDQNDQRNYHFIEQAGFAASLAGVMGLPIEQYHIKNDVSANTIVKHYTSPRRPLFYIEGLKKIN